MIKRMIIIDKIKDLQKVCKIISKLKSQLIDELPHYGHDALFLKNDEITTGVLNNITEIKINLVTGELLYFHNEQGHIVDLSRHEFIEKLKDTVSIYGLNIPQITGLRNLNTADLSDYLAFAKKVNTSLELFRMKLTGHFTQVHLWPDGFDYSVEWFTGKKEEQIGLGISPGEDKYQWPYLYVNPYPFKETMTNESLVSGIWHTDGWKGVKVEWKDLENKTEKQISDQIYELFLIAQHNFQK